MKLVLVCVIVLSAACEEGSEDVFPGVCGDGMVSFTDEECDDGNVVPGDGCSSACTYEPGSACGDGVVDLGEECDDGNTDNDDACTNRCELGGCGDGIVDLLEQCDEGVTELCDADCTYAECGDGTVNETAGEACDQPAETATCDVDCTPVTCGDGTVNVAAGEECDDANTEPGDGCFDCLVETTTGCAAIGALACGTSITGDTLGAGATDQIDTYTCLAGDHSGNEHIYEWTADLTGTVSVFLEESSPPSTNVVVMADGACGAGACLASGGAGATFDAVLGTRYLIIVDATDFASFAQYQVGLICP